MQRSEDVLLGRLAVREGICTSVQIDECLRLQSQAREYSPLGDLLLFKGFLTAVQLKDLLSRQHKKVMSCARCALSFTVLTLTEGKSARCPRCKEPLAETAASGPTRTDADFSTQRIRRVPAPTGPKRRLQCVICDHDFEGALDPFGRVQCPACQSNFTLRTK